MQLVPMDPFSMLREFDRFFGGSRSADETWAPRVDVLDRDSDLVVRVEVAGVDPDAIDVTVEDRTLTISGNRLIDDPSDDPGFHRREIAFGDFKRTLVLPDGLDAKAISATADKGVLEVTVPRKPEILPRKVKVDVTA